HITERIQHLERFGVELGLRRHLKEQVDIRARINVDIELAQHATQDLPLDLPERLEGRSLRRLEVEVDPDSQKVVTAYGQTVISHDLSGDQHQALVPQQRAIGVEGHRFDSHPAS